MIVTLDKIDLISLVKGTSPNYDVMNNPKIKGSYSDQYGRWDWDQEYLETRTESELIQVYRICKHSWDK